MIGYFEGIGAERGIAWRLADSLALRRFVGIALDEYTPDHSTISRTRRLIDLETHAAVFAWVLDVLARRGLIVGKRVAIDATTLEANAAMRSIVRRDTGESYEEFLTGLAKASGIETPTREDLARLDRKRKKRTSNKEWKSPADEDARIAKMKDGRTHLAHKAEHAVDLDTGAVVAVTLQAADKGDTTTLDETLMRGRHGGGRVGRAARPSCSLKISPRSTVDGIEELVADKGYHSGAALKRVKSYGVRSYIPEKKQKGQAHTGRARRSEQQAVYENRRRVRGEYGKSLLRRRGELVERSFAHCYETGGMRRCHLRGRENILKRQLVHVGCLQPEPDHAQAAGRWNAARAEKPSRKRSFCAFSCAYLPVSLEGALELGSAPQPPLPQPIAPSSYKHSHAKIRPIAPRAGSAANLAVQGGVKSADGEAVQGFELMGILTKLNQEDLQSRDEEFKDTSSAMSEKVLPGIKQSDQECGRDRRGRGNSQDRHVRPGQGLRQHRLLRNPCDLTQQRHKEWARSSDLALIFWRWCNVVIA